MFALLSLGVVALAFMALFWLTPFGVLPLKRLGAGRPSPDLTFGYTAEETYRLLELYGARGRSHWRRLLLADMIFPAVYGALLAQLGLAWVAWLAAGSPWSTLVVAFPVVAAAADYAENILLLRVIADMPHRSPGLVASASTFTRLKFLCFAATLILPLAWWAIPPLAHLL